MTECNQETFAFTVHFSRRVEARFTAGQVCSDGGALLLREVDRKINLLGRLTGSFVDGRSPLLVQHQLPQRIFGLALGYEDHCDHEQLRSDPLPGPDRAARRLRLLPRRVDGLVRGQQGGLPVWLGAQPTVAEDHRPRCSKLVFFLRPPARRRASLPSAHRETA